MMEDGQQSQGGFYRMPHVQGNVCVFIAEDDVWRCDLGPERCVRSAHCVCAVVRLAAGVRARARPVVSVHAQVDRAPRLGTASLRKHSFLRRCMRK